MTLVVYAVTDADPGGVDASGLQGQPLRSVSHDALAAVVSDCEEARLDPSATLLWDYEQVVEQLMARGTILPMRFGTVLAGEPQVRDLIRERHDALALGLERVRGAVELAVRAGWREPPAPATTGEATGTGTAYMLDRVALHRRAQELADRLDPLSALARDMHRRLLERGDLPVLGAYLVEQGLVGQFTDRVRDLDERHADIELVCTGPWPPYSFAPRTSA